MNKYFILSVLCGVLLVFQSGSARAAEGGNTSFDHIMKTRTLRCSYAPIAPFIKVDPATGSKSGLFYDIVNEIGRRLDIKVDWTEEVGYGQIAAGFQSGRYDAFCGTLWETPTRATAMGFSAPLYYNKVNPCVRGDTTIYDKSSDPLNAPDKTLIGYDGDVSMQMARTLFPRAKTLSLPENIPFGEAMLYITTGKADAIATCDRTVVDDMNKNHKGALKIAAPNKPISYVQVALALPLGDVALKNMVDTALFDMRADGTLKRLMVKWLGADLVDDTMVIPAIK